MYRTCTIVTAIFLFAVSSAHAQNWMNPAGGSYDDPTNWNGDAVPTAPIFNLGSATGYTVTTSKTEQSGTLAVQTDTLTLNLNTFTYINSELDVATSAGQNGSLTVLGPGTINSVGPLNSPGAGIANVGTNGGTGQLILDDATFWIDGNISNGIHASNMTVKNGGQIKVGDNDPVVITNATFNNGSMTGQAAANLSNVTISNNSNVSAGFSLTLGGGTIDNSTVESGEMLSITGNLTLSNGALVEGSPAAVSGDVTVLAGTHLRSTSPMTMQGGTVSVELNALVSDPIRRPSTLDNGTLDITLQNGFAPSAGEQFDIFDGTFGTGTFATLNLPTLPTGQFWNTSQLYTTGAISIVPEPTSCALILIGITASTFTRRGKPLAR